MPTKLAASHFIHICFSAVSVIRILISCGDGVRESGDSETWFDRGPRSLKTSASNRLSALLRMVGLLTCRSQWPRGLRRRSATVRLLRSWVRIPPGAWMFVCCECCVLSGRGLCDELITRPEESYRLWCVVVCDLDTSRMRRPWSALGRSATAKIWAVMAVRFTVINCQHNEHEVYVEP